MTVALVSIVVIVSIIRYQGNFHEISEGKFYRSAQLNKDQFASYIQRYKIKSILNLRGENPKQPWYRDEMFVATNLKVAHFDYALSATHAVKQQQIDEIIDIISRAPLPILVHCQAGADRTGLVAAIYEYVFDNKSAAIADQQLSLKYGHFPYLGSKTHAMDKSFWLYITNHPNRLQKTIDKTKPITAVHL